MTLAIQLRATAASVVAGVGTSLHGDLLGSLLVSEDEPVDVFDESTVHMAAARARLSDAST